MRKLHYFKWSSRHKLDSNRYTSMYGHSAQVTHIIKMWPQTRLHVIREVSQQKNMVRFPWILQTCASVPPEFAGQRKDSRLRLCFVSALIPPYFVSDIVRLTRKAFPSKQKTERERWCPLSLLPLFPLCT